MSAPQSTPPKGPRRHPKKPQHGGQNSRSVVSDNDAYTTLADNNTGSGDGKARARRKSHATKNRHVQNDAAAYSDSSTHRPASHHNKTAATPIKQQAYAGPTFHQSPAASALPLPSFYSKSLPNASPLKVGIDGTQSPSRPATGMGEDVVPPLPTETKRESTPLDFLFDAARKAGATPGTESPNHRHYLSSAADTPISRSPAPREGEADFPFELDSGDQIGPEPGSTFSTPYKDRIEAARSQRTPSAGVKTLDDDERKTKSAQLKQFLMNSAQGSDSSVDSNPFNARPAPPQNWQYGHRSNPNTPYNGPGQTNAPQYFPQMPPMPNMYHHRSPSRQNQFSNLRNVYQPGYHEGTMPPSNEPVDQTRISTARDQIPARPNYAEIYSSPNKARDQSPGHQATPSAQQLEDDLRKFLKLDLVSRG